MQRALTSVCCVDTGSTQLAVKAYKLILHACAVHIITLCIVVSYLFIIIIFILFLFKLGEIVKQHSFIVIKTSLN